MLTRRIEEGKEEKTLFQCPKRQTKTGDRQSSTSPTKQSKQSNSTRNKKGERRGKDILWDEV
jgi:hypothetical protein